MTSVLACYMDRVRGHSQRRTGTDRWPLVFTTVSVLVLASCSGDPGPMGPQGPPGRSQRGVAYAARFSHPEELGTWLYTVAGSWKVDGGQLIVRGGRDQQAIIGPATEMPDDLDVSVEATWLLRPGGTACGLRFHVGVEGAYELRIYPEGAFAFYRWAGDGEVAGPLVDWTETSRLVGATANELRVTKAGRDITIYVNGIAVGEVTDSALSGGLVQLFVEGAAEVAFDNLWVNAALPLR